MHSAIAGLIRALNQRKRFSLHSVIAGLKGMLKRKEILSLRQWLTTRMLTIGDEENGLPVVSIMVVSILILIIASLLPLGCRSAVAAANHSEHNSSYVSPGNRLLASP
jgi:hypothetical protein